MRSPAPDDERCEALLDVVRLRRPLDQAIQVLRRFPWAWDCDEPLVVMTREDVLRAIEAYRSGALSAAGLEAWAEALEMRDDLDLDDERREALLGDFIFAHANPVLEGPVTPASVEAWRARIGAPDGG